MAEPPDIPETVSSAASGRPPDGATTEPAAVGRYRIVRRIGQGGFGQVYLAHDDALDRPVAIKVPKSERISRPEDVEVYLSEARTVAGLDHPAIVPVHDVGRTADGLCYVVSKYIEGCDLAARIKADRPSHRESAELVSTIAEALHHAHKNGLVHRDVKPANILLDASGRAMLVDFGLALRDEDHGRNAAVAGTPAYMSPEQAGGDGHRVDGRSDIFSLGTVFYELLTGKRPFQADTQQELLGRILRDEVRPPRQIDDTIPPELERICLKALSKRTSQRYTTASDMAFELRRWAAESNPAGIVRAGGEPSARPPAGSAGRSLLQIEAKLGGQKGCLLNISILSVGLMIVASVFFPSLQSRRSASNYPTSAPSPDASLMPSMPARAQEAQEEYEAGEHYLKNRNFRFALDAFSRAIARLESEAGAPVPLTVKCYLGRARAYAGLDQDDQAITELWKAHGLEPEVLFQGWNPGE